MVSVESLQKFKNIYERQYGVLLSDSEALSLANNLLNLYRAVYINKNNISMNNNAKENKRKTG